MDNPEALIAFKERNWPIFREVTASEVSDTFGDLIDDVDRGALTGEFADWVASSFREALRVSYWGWFDDDMAMIQAVGFDLDAITVPVHVWQGRHDRMVPYARRVAGRSRIPTAIRTSSTSRGTCPSRSTRWSWILDELVVSGG